MLKKLTKDTFYKLGYRISRVHAPRIGVDPFSDFLHFLGPTERPTIFDVGANSGQSVEWFKRIWPAGQIHSFEPSPTTFELLTQNAATYSDVHPTNAALGKENATLELIENTDSSMSSLREPGKYAWGELKGKTEINVITLDDYCDQNAIEQIDVLKIDTQGYEHEVLQGAARMLGRHRIRLVYLELIFSEQYKNIVPADETIGLLRKAGFQLVTIYEQFYQDDVLSWTDALFRSTNPVDSSQNGRHH